MASHTTRDEPEHLMFFPPADRNRCHNGDAPDSDAGLFSGRETQ